MLPMQGMWLQSLVCESYMSHCVAPPPPKKKLYFIKKIAVFPSDIQKSSVFLLNIFFCQSLNSSMVIIDLFVFFSGDYVSLSFIYMCVYVCVCVCVCVCVYFKAMILFSWVPKSLWVVTTAMKLKDTCYLEEKNKTNLDSVLKSRQSLG